MALFSTVRKSSFNVVRCDPQRLPVVTQNCEVLDKRAKRQFLQKRHILW